MDYKIPGARAEIMRKYEFRSYKNNTIITSPGKFENEPIFAPYIYNLMLDGVTDVVDVHDCDEDHDDCDSFTRYDIIKPSKDELEEFPEMGRYLPYIILFENDHGFVEILSRYDFKKSAWRELGVEN